MLDLDTHALGDVLQERAGSSHDLQRGLGAVQALADLAQLAPQQADPGLMLAELADRLPRLLALQQACIAQRPHLAIKEEYRPSRRR